MFCFVRRVKRPAYISTSIRQEEPRKCSWLIKNWILTYQQLSHFNNFPNQQAKEAGETFLKPSDFNRPGCDWNQAIQNTVIRRSAGKITLVNSRHREKNACCWLFHNDSSSLIVLDMIISIGAGDDFPGPPRWTSANAWAHLVQPR